MITKIHIDNFRCFSNFDFEPEKTNLLLGINGSGKSSLFDVVSKIIDVVVEGKDVSDVFSPDDLTRWDSRKEHFFEFEYQLEEKSYRYQLKILHGSEPGNVEIVRESVVCDGKTLFAQEEGSVHLHTTDGKNTRSFPFGRSRSILGDIEERPGYEDLIALIEYFRRFRILKVQPPQITGISHEENTSLHTDGRNFSSWYRHISQERAGELATFTQDLREALPGFHSLALKGAGKHGRTRDLIAEFKTSGGKSYDIDFEALSDGQRALIVVHALLLEKNNEPFVLLLDEPENYIGLPEIQPWLVLLDEYLGDEGQLFIISHHPGVIDFLAAEYPILFDRPDNGPVRLRENFFYLDEGLKASEQIARGLINEKEKK